MFVLVQGILSKMAQQIWIFKHPKEMEYSDVEELGLSSVSSAGCLDAAFWKISGHVLERYFEYQNDEWSYGLKHH